MFQNYAPTLDNLDAVIADLQAAGINATKLGMDKIAGYACQSARVISSKGNDFEVCVTREFGPSTDWIAAMNRNDPEARSWLKALKDQGIEVVAGGMNHDGLGEPLSGLEQAVE